MDKVTGTSSLKQMTLAGDVHIEQLDSRERKRLMLLQTFADALGCSLGHLENLGSLDCNIVERCRQLEERCATLTKRCDELQKSSCSGKCSDTSVALEYCMTNTCPGNIPFSRITLEDQSQQNVIVLSEIVDVPNDPNFVNAWPVQPGKSIRLRHLQRPGFVPRHINMDFAFANNGNNYLELQIEFFLVGGPKPRLIGSTYEGNNFLNKDGTQIIQEWPSYLGKSIEVGFFEHVEVVITHTGLQNNLNKATVRLHHDTKEWWDLCRKFGYCAPGRPHDH